MVTDELPFWIVIFFEDAVQVFFCEFRKMLFRNSFLIEPSV